MLAFIDKKTYEVRTAQTGPDKANLTTITGPADLARKFSLAELAAIAKKIGSTPVPAKVGKDKVAPRLWRDVIAEAERLHHAEPDDLSDMPTRLMSDALRPDYANPATEDGPDTPVTLQKVVPDRNLKDMVRTGTKPRLRGFKLHNAPSDLTSLPPQAALIAQALLREAALGTTEMNAAQVEDFLVRLNLHTRQEPWRIFRYYHRHLALLGLISPLTGKEAAHG